MIDTLRAAFQLHEGYPSAGRRENPLKLCSLSSGETCTVLKMCESIQE